MAGRLAAVALLVLAPFAVAPAATAAPAGEIFVADFNAFADGGGGVIRVDPISGARRVVSANATSPGGPSFVDPAGMAPAPGGDLLVADMNAYGGPGGVIRVNPVTGARSTVSANLAPLAGPGFEDPSGIALDRNGDLLIADRGAFADGTGGIIRVDIETGQRTAVSHNAAPAGGPAFVEPVAVAVAPNGDILVTDEDAFGDSSGGVIRVDPVSGARTTVSANDAPAGGPSFVEPVGILRAPDGHLLVVEEDGFGDRAGGVIRVDPVSGARSTLSANGAPTGGPAFRQPYGATLAPDGGLLVADFDAFADRGGGVIRVDRANGARRTLSANAAPAGGTTFVDPVAIVFRAAGLATPPRSAPPPAGGRPDAVAPVIRSASVRPRAFVVTRRGRATTRRAVPRGTTFRFEVSEPARVTFTIERKARGRRVARRCRRSTRRYRGRPACILLRRAGSFAARATAGRNRRRFSGRIGRRALRTGRYRVTLRATDAAGNRSRARRLAFRVVD